MTSRAGSRSSIILAFLLSLTTIVSADRGVSPTPVHVAPVVTSISPTGGAPGGGTTVIITGSGFQQGGDPVLAVNFGVTGAVFTVNSDTQITATSPASAPGTVDVRVGTSSQSAIVPGDQFTYAFAPQVDTVVPDSGPAAGGTFVTIGGLDFTGATEVRFGNTILTTGQFTVVNSTTITTTTPARAAGPALIRVTTPSGSATGTAVFSYIAAPTVSAIAPNHGPAAGGMDVTITGTNLTGATGVTIDGVSATSVVVVNATTITAKTPARPAGTVASVVVTTPGGTNAANTLFSYDAAVAVPTVTAISASNGYVIDALPSNTAVTLTLTGTNFGTSGADITSVTFSGAAAGSFAWVSSTSATAVTPANLAPGTYNVALTTAGGTGTLPNGITVVAPPAVTSVSPVSGAALTATLVTLTGINFGAVTNTPVVTYGPSGTGSIATNPIWISPTSISATVGTDVGANVAVKFIVTINNIASAASTATFTGLPLPTVTGISPVFGREAGGTTVVISGTNFAGATSVQFGSAGSAVPTSSSNTSVTVTSPAGVGAGTVDLQVTTAGGQSVVNAADKFTYIPPPSLVIVSVSPGTAGVANTITLTGLNFGLSASGLTSVKIGTTTVTSTYVSSSSVTAVVPTSLAAGTYDVTITTTGGSSTKTSAFSLSAAPVTITGISPNNGPVTGGTPVMITGTNFTGVTSVTFGGNAATITSSANGTQLSVTTPAVGSGAGIVAVVVNTPGGSGSSTFNYSPVITSIAPSSASANTAVAVTLTGAGFSGASPTATYGPTGTETVATVVNVSSDTSMVVLTAADINAGAAVKFRVTAGGQPSAVSTATLTGVAAPTPPTITSITPEVGPIAGGTTVLISGTNFTDVRSVSFNGTPAASFIWSNSTPTQITAVSPSGTANASGPISVTSGSGPAVLSPKAFTWCGTPTVTGVSPSSVTNGATVTVSGTNFCPQNTVVQVQVGLTSLNQTTTFLDSFRLSFIADITGAIGNVTPVIVRGGRGARVEAALTGLRVVALGPGGASPPSPAAVISITPAPLVTSVTPATGPLTGGTSVTITGSDFSGASAVRFGAVAASTFTVVSDTTIIATSPANAAGVVDIVVVTASGASTPRAADQFVYAVGVPTMGEWFTLMLAMLLAGVGYLTLRQRARAQRLL